MQLSNSFTKMRRSNSDVWTHIVLSTKNQEKIFREPEIETIVLALEEFKFQQEDESITFSVLPEHIHILLRLPDSMSLKSLVGHLQTFIKTKMSFSPGLISDFQWEKEFHAHSVSVNRLSSEKNMILRQDVKHREMTFEEELKFLGL
jgi:putative transposase